MGDVQLTGPVKCGQATSHPWERVGSRCIYFGHQSVGFNLMHGVHEVLETRCPNSVRLVEASDLGGLTGPAFAHGRVGANLDPRSKLEAFGDRLRSGANWVEFAFLKFCYADIRAGTDVAALFADYERTMAELAAAHPGVRLLHMTVPLMSLPSLPKRIAKRLLRRPVREFADNRARESFNDRMRSRFASGRALFDIARFESTRPDRRRVSMSGGGASMYPGYTDDRGHLGALGRRVIAGELLDWLVEATR